MGASLSGRVVVVSPHVDDAVLSLGTTIARAARRGVKVEVLTVFGRDPDSPAPANGWDRRAGFATQGEAAAARRVEDRKACALLGAEPSWLTFAGGGYDEPRDGGAVWTAVGEAVEGADAVLVPGFPLTNEDHSWLGRLLVERRLPAARTGLYVEQPYRYMARRESLPTALEWTRTRPGIGDYRLKRKAILAYVSQLPMLGFDAGLPRKLDRMLLHEMLRRGEAVAWLR